MQYLTAKRLLSDLSVLTYQLHAFCAEAAQPTTTGTRPRGPAETGKLTGSNHHDSDERRSTSPTGGGGLPTSSSSTTAADKNSPRSRSQTPDSSRRLAARPLPVLVLRRKTTIAGPKPTRPLSPPPSGRPLLQVAGRIAELVTAVMSHPLAHPPGSATATCRAVEDLRRGALAATPPAYSSPLARGPATGGAGSPPPSGAVRAVGSLVSLVAAMVGTEKERWQRQPSSSGVAVLGAEKKKDNESGQRRNNAASPIEASSHAATGSLETEKEGAAMPLSDGLLCLSSAVVQAANLACVLDLEAVQVYFF